MRVNLEDALALLDTVGSVIKVAVPAVRKIVSLVDTLHKRSRK